MLLLISPAKSLDFDTPLPPGVVSTAPRFQRQAADLIRVLRQHSPAELSALMGISDKLATLNVARYRAWRLRPKLDAARPALFAFNGDVYDGLAARSLTPDDWDWAQQHLRILSGLYGVLRPLDLIQPHRLEMGTRLATDQAAHLYGFWADRVARTLQDDLSSAAGHAPAATPSDAVIVNLASQEYFKVVRPTALNARVVECVFEEQRDTDFKVISFMAKRARGLMAQQAIRNRWTHSDDLKNFKSDGYCYADRASAPDRLVFRRREMQA